MRLITMLYDWVSYGLFVNRNTTDQNQIRWQREVYQVVAAANQSELV